MTLEQLVYKIKRAGDNLFANKRAQLLKRGSRYVLFIGDEGAILVYIKDNIVKSRQFIPDMASQHLENLRESMKPDPSASLLVVVDTIDQSYIQQTLPPVSALSIKKLIRRRLERDFGAEDIKGAVILGREPSGRKDWNFMMISLERTPLLSTWIEFISSLPNRFQGFYLVAAESEVIIKNLERKIAEGPGSDWKFFVSHNKVSGFRQVILHKGRVVFTRMAQPVGEATAEVMAGNIEQEMLNTIEYMRRLSFDPQDGLDVYIIASAAIREALDTAKFDATVKHAYVLTPYEVAQHLDIEGATQPADQYGDVVLAASIGLSMRHVLTLHTAESQKFSHLYQLMQGQRVAAGVLSAFCILYILGIILMMYGTFLDANNQQAIKEEQQKKLDLVRLAIRQSSVDVEKTNDMIDLYSRLEKERFNPTFFLDHLQKSMISAVVVKGVEISYSKPDQASSVPGSPLSDAGGPAKILASVTLEFPGVTTLESFKPVSEKLIDNLRQALPGFNVGYSRLPNIFSESEKLDMTFGDNKVEDSNLMANQSLDVVLSISGLVEAIDNLPDMVPSAGEEYGEEYGEGHGEANGEAKP